MKLSARAVCLLCQRAGLSELFILFQKILLPYLDLFEVYSNYSPDLVQIMYMTDARCLASEKRPSFKKTAVVYMFLITLLIIYLAEII